MPRLMSLLPVLTAGVLGCIEVPEGEAPLEALEQPLAGCTSKWECGSNSPVIATTAFHELNVDGLPNLEGFSVVGLVKAGVPYKLSVERGRIVGRNGTSTLQDAALKKAQIRLHRGGMSYAIEIADVGVAETWARVDGVPKQLQTYLFRATQVINNVPSPEWTRLCSNPLPASSEDELGMDPEHGLVFETDRIDAELYELRQPDPRWFNITCAGHALAKLALTGHTESSRFLGFNTTILERQTELKMYAGDYCGVGEPFTVADQPVQIADVRGYMKLRPGPFTLVIEALWTPKGAACLNTPRVDVTFTQLGWDVFEGKVRDKIKATCGVKPPCLGPLTSFDGKTHMSVNMF